MNYKDIFLTCHRSKQKQLIGSRVGVWFLCPISMVESFVKTETALVTKWIHSSAEWLGDSAAVLSPRPCNLWRALKGHSRCCKSPCPHKEPCSHSWHGVRLRQSRPLASPRDVHGCTSKQSQGLTGGISLGVPFLLIEGNTPRTLGLFFLSNVLMVHIDSLLCKELFKEMI